MIKCENYNKELVKNVSEDSRFQNNLIGSCNKRNVCVNKKFCKYCNMSIFGSPCCRSEMREKKNNFGTFYQCMKCFKKINKKILKEFYQKEVSKENMVLEIMNNWEGEHRE